MRCLYTDAETQLPGPAPQCAACVLTREAVAMHRTVPSITTQHPEAVHHQTPLLALWRGPAGGSHRTCAVAAQQLSGWQRIGHTQDALQDGQRVGSVASAPLLPKNALQGLIPRRLEKGLPLCGAHGRLQPYFLPQAQCHYDALYQVSARTNVQRLDADTMRR